MKCTTFICFYSSYLLPNARCAPTVLLRATASVHSKGGNTYNQTAEEMPATNSRATAKCQQKHIVTNMTLSCRVRSHLGPFGG